ncbi:hypothetical protein L0F63_001817 [Massospora cicadina]|nr:hypothetical protein L0F63_001817 [Massospora cicadina]
MPGEITHTNEFTVLLGENWFVERSATQTQAIMERRQSYLQEQMASLKSDLLNMGQKAEVTNEVFGISEHEVGEDGTKMVEIKEEYVPEPETLKLPNEPITSRPLRQKSQQELEEDQAILDAINKIYEDEQNGLVDEEESEDEKCKYQDSDQEDEDERYREGLSYAGGVQDDSDDSHSDEEEPVSTPQKKQVRFSDSVLEPSSRDPSEFRSDPLWKMLQAATLDRPSESAKPHKPILQSWRASIMSETVVENENIGPVDVDELEMAIDMQVIAEEYQRRKQSIIRSNGGYALSPQEQELKEYTKYTFDAPNEEGSREPSKPRKVSSQMVLSYLSIRPSFYS